MEQTEKKNKLSAFLSVMSDDELIFVSSATSWFFVGTVSEYRHYEKAIDRKLLDYFSRRIRNEKDNIRRLCTSYINDVTSEANRHKRPEADGYNLTTWYRALQKNIQCRNTFVPTMEREVVNSYPRIKEGTAIIVEGEEVGEYYDSEEWEQFGGKKKLEKYMEEIRMEEIKNEED